MVDQQTKDNPGGDAEPDNPADRRKHFRVEVPLKARFLNEKGTEEACEIINVSAGGALLRAKHPPGFGQPVVLYIDQLGRFEGKVIRSGASSFAISYNRKKSKTARTADHLTQIVNRGKREEERRDGPRLQHDAPAIVQFEDGHTEECAILDISLTGASIQINPRPPLGTALILGRMTAKVVRRHEEGVGVVFTGSADRIDEVINETSTTEKTSETGAPLARSFGKKV